MTDYQERGNSLVKFFKYKEIKTKYKKHSRTTSQLSVPEKPKADTKEHLNIKFRLDNSVILQLKDLEQ